MADLLGSERDSHVHPSHVQLPPACGVLGAAMSQEHAATAATAPPAQQAAPAEYASAGLAAPALADRLAQHGNLAPAEHSQPSNDLLEILEELCRERELEVETIDDSIRARLAEVPNSLRFRPGSGSGRLLPLTCSAQCRL